LGVDKLKGACFEIGAIPFRLITGN